MDTKKLLKELTPEKLPYPLSEYAKAIGTENLCALSEIAGGEKIYIPKTENLLKEIIKNMIIEKHNSGKYTQEELSKKYNRSTKTISTYINQN